MKIYNKTLIEAQKLAEQLDNPACVMIRKLMAEIVEQERLLDKWAESAEKVIVKTQLSDEEMFKIMQEWGRKQFGDDYADPDMEDLKLTIGLHRAIIKEITE